MNHKIKYISFRDPSTRLFEQSHPVLKMDPSALIRQQRKFQRIRATYSYHTGHCYSLVYLPLKAYRPFCSSSLELLSASGSGTVSLSPPTILPPMKLC